MDETKEKNKKLGSCKRKSKCWKKGIDNDWVNEKHNLRINTLKYPYYRYITILESKNKKIKHSVISDTLKEVTKVEKDLMKKYNKC